MMFDVTGPHWCPKCPAIHAGKSGRRIDPPLVEVASNYSGTGVDIASCPRCDKSFQISYKVDEIVEIESLKEKE